MASPRFTPERNGTFLKLTFENPAEGDSIRIYLGEGELGVPELYAEGVILSFVNVHGLIADKNYTILAAFANDNFDASFTVVSEDADGYVLTPAPEVTYTETTELFEIPWGEDINIDMYNFTNLTKTEGRKGRKKVTIGENQTL